MIDPGTPFGYEKKILLLGIALVAIAFLFGGCATLDDKWSGWYDTDILAYYGEPTRKIISGKSEIWQYREKNKSMKGVFVPRYKPTETIRTFRMRNGFIVEATEKTR